MGQAPISSRLAIRFAVAAVGLELVAIVLYDAASGFRAGLSVDPATLLASGPSGASLIRWGSLIDMFGYLSIVPVVVYLRNRYGTRYGDLFALAGLGLVVIGSVGAAAMATAAPPMINGFGSADAAEKQALLPAFSALYRTVVLGLWQTLESILAAVWLLGSGAAVRREGPRSVMVILFAFGLLTAAIAVYRLVAG